VVARKSPSTYRQAGHLLDYASTTIVYHLYVRAIILREFYDTLVRLPEDDGSLDLGVGRHGLGVIDQDW
jgi:hypothetical protein